MFSHVLFWFQLWQLHVRLSIPMKNLLFLNFVDWYLMTLGLQIHANECLDLLFACAHTSILLSFVFIFLYAIIQIFLQMDYINTSHSSFVGGSKVVELAKHEGLSSRGPTSLSVHKVPSFPPQILYLFLNNIKEKSNVDDWDVPLQQ